MYKIGEFVYDSDTMMFFRDSLTSDEIDQIKTKVRISDKYDELMTSLKTIDHRNTNTSSIDLIGICLTYNCQLRCNYCSYDSAETNRDILTSKNVLAFVIEAIKRRRIRRLISILDESKPIQFFFTGGGEPTYNWSLFRDVVSTISEKCREYSIPFRLELTTNGMLSDYQREFIASNFDKIMISYDGMPRFQEQNRSMSNGESSSSIVESSITYFSQSSIPLTIRSTVWSYDFCYLRQMYDYLESKFDKFHEWTIMPILPSGRALYAKDTDIYDKGKYDFWEAYIDLLNYSKQKENPIEVYSPIFNDEMHDYFCGAVFKDCHWIMPDNNIINCIESAEFSALPPEFCTSMRVSPALVK